MAATIAILHHRKNKAASSRFISSERDGEERFEDELFNIAVPENVNIYIHVK